MTLEYQMPKHCRLYSKLVVFYHTHTSRMEAKLITTLSLTQTGEEGSPKKMLLTSMQFVNKNILRLIPLPVPNWASAEEQFIPNYPPQITIYSKFFFENPNFSLSTKFFLLDLSVGVLNRKEELARSEFKIWPTNCDQEVDNLEKQLKFGSASPGKF